MRQKSGVNFMGGESTSPNNPEKGCSGKSKTKDADHMKYALTGDKKFMSAWT